MTHLKKILIFTALLLLLSQVLFCSKGENILRVTAVGKSSPTITRPEKARAMALRAAKVEGYRELARAAGMEKVYRPNRGAGYRPNSEPGHRVEAFMKGARVVGKRFISDHEVEIIMEIEISEIVDIASLRNRIAFLQKEMSRIRTQLKKAKRTLRKLEEKSP